MIDLFAWLGLAAALLPAAMFAKNRRLFRAPAEQLPPAAAADTQPITVSVLIPARNEQQGIGQAIASVLASRAVTVEVVVLDDHSSDGTAAEVQKLAAADGRVRLLSGQDLPAGWNGKQFACYQLSQAARYDRLLFLDADVRLQPTAIADLVSYQDAGGAALLSIFPRQLTGTWLECWLIPLMYVILLGYLPIERMRASRHPAYASGCGQCFLTRRSDYQAAGTHQAIRQSRHDGLKLPAAYRRSGLATDIADGTDLATCRMYRSAGEVIRGVLKNADEALAAPGKIVPFSLLLLGATLCPWITLIVAVQARHWLAMVVSAVAILLGHWPRWAMVRQFRQSLLGAICHTPAVVVFVALQWLALGLRLTGRRVAWRGR